MESSLIFLVIIGLWGVFVVPHWLRRREQIGASRARDRFSTAMRVLGRRVHRPAAARTPTRPSVLKAPRVPAQAPPPPAEMIGAKLPVPQRIRMGSMLLLVTLVLLVAAVPAAAALVVLGVLPLWTTCVPICAAVGFVVLLRARATRRRRLVRTPTPTLRTAGVDESPVPQPRTTTPAPSPEAPPVAAPVPEPGTWTPVPVPLPTYLLKPAAPRRLVEPLPPAVTPAARVWDLDEVLERRRAVNA